MGLWELCSLTVVLWATDVVRTKAPLLIRFTQIWAFPAFQSCQIFTDESLSVKSIWFSMKAWKEGHHMLCDTCWTIMRKKLSDQEQQLFFFFFSMKYHGSLRAFGCNADNWVASSRRMDDDHNTGSDQRASQPLTSTVISSAETAEAVVQDYLKIF